MAEKAFEENLRLMERYPAAGKARIQAPPRRAHRLHQLLRDPAPGARASPTGTECGIQIHVAEIPRAFLVEKYGKSAPQVLEEQGVLGPDVVAAHCIDLTDEDLEILRRNKVNVAHTPMTNSLGGNGVARVPDMLERGMNVTLGHDCFFTLDISEYLRYAYLVHKAHRANPALIPPFQALDMALGNAARALGLGERIGSLAAGKCADILIVRPDSPSPVVPAVGAVLVHHDVPGPERGDRDRGREDRGEGRPADHGARGRGGGGLRGRGEEAVAQERHRGVTREREWQST